MKKEIKIFFRQSFTEAGEHEQQIIQEVINKINNYQDNHHEVRIVTGNKAHNKTSFKHSFEQDHQLKFTPDNFRKKRLKLLSDSDLFIILRTGMSESTAFEVAYNIYKGNNIPMLFLVWEKAQIKTTLIREMEGTTDVTYYTFKNIDELGVVIRKFISDKKSLNKLDYKLVSQ